LFLAEYRKKKKQRKALHITHDPGHKTILSGFSVILPLEILKIVFI